MDEISKRIVHTLEKAGEPLETREIERAMSDVTRTKIMNRLKDLALDGKSGVKGKRAGAGSKGVWIWWSHSGK